MRIVAIIGLAGALSGLLAAAEPVKLPYVYTKWKQFTVADGLPNDHIFAVKADGPRVWIGTEDGLAMLDKRTGKIKSWGEKDGLPWKVITAIDVDKKTGDVWLGLFGGGLARFSGGRFDHWHQLNSGLVNDVGTGRIHLGGDHGRREPLQYGDRRVGDLHREELAHGRDMEL
jgi:ligand-binding sensor domain-containing protein